MIWSLVLLNIVLTLGYIPVILVLPRRRHHSPKLICGCTHHLAFHDRKTGRCNNYQPGVHEAKTGACIQCKCQQYTGPQPLPEYYPPELTDGQ